MKKELGVSVCLLGTWVILLEAGDHKPSCSSWLHGNLAHPDYRGNYLTCSAACNQIKLTPVRHRAVKGAIDHAGWAPGMLISKITLYHIQRPPHAKSLFFHNFCTVISAMQL